MPLCHALCMVRDIGDQTNRKGSCVPSTKTSRKAGALSLVKFFLGFDSGILIGFSKSWLVDAARGEKLLRNILPKLRASLPG